MITLMVISEEYGCEKFEYGSVEEAVAGKNRIARKAAELNDDVERIYVIEITND